jgi:predicted Zn-dependent protease
MNHLRSRLAALLLALLANGLVLSDAGNAQNVARDYYASAGDRAATAALRNLDRFHYQPAMRNLRSGKYKFALADLEFMLKYFPNHPQALAAIAEVGLAAKRPEIAEQPIKEALALYPQHDETYVIYGTFLQQRGQVDAAIAEYKKALRIDESRRVHATKSRSWR